jgi:hypothetical protein
VSFENEFSIKHRPLRGDLVAHDLDQAQGAKHAAHSLHASADRAGNLAGIPYSPQSARRLRRRSIAEQQST